MLWRRFVVSSKCTLADLHFVLQIGFGWTDFHLHRFRVRKKDYAVPRLCGIACAHDAREVTLADLHFPPINGSCTSITSAISGNSKYALKNGLDELLEDIKARETEMLEDRLEELDAFSFSFAV
jgi:hypothetical protein